VDREHRDQLAALVDRAAELEDQARKVQAEDDEDAAAVLLRQLERDYLTWQSTALSLLPDDLRQPFSFEYEGTIFQGRIRHFIQSGRQENIFWADGDDAMRRAFGRWQYSFNDAFRGPLLAQKKILLDAVARYGASGDTLNALGLLERVFRNLPFAIATLGRTVRDRPGIVVNDEYDLQRIVHAVLQLHFQDVREEEFSPS
jgi:REase_DpnII-MboI